MHDGGTAAQKRPAGGPVCRMWPVVSQLRLTDTLTSLSVKLQTAVGAVS